MDLSLVLTGGRFFMNEVFSEHFARRNNFFTLTDARIKIAFVITAIVTVLSSHTLCVSLVVTVLVIASLFNIKISFKIVILRLSASLSVAITLLFIKIFFFHQAFSDSLLIMLKIIASTSLLLFLSMTTTVDKLLGACYWFKVPGIWVEICLIAYRYIFVLLEDALTVRDAQRVRLGYTNLACTLRSIGILSGAIIVRAYDQSISTYEAMMLRGYRGKTQSLFLENRLILKDVVGALIFIAILVLLIMLNHFFKV